MKVKGVVEESDRRCLAIVVEVAQSLRKSPSVQERKCGMVRFFAKSQMLSDVLQVCQRHGISLDSHRCMMQSVVA